MPPLLLLLYGAGLRIGEALALERAAVGRDPARRLRTLLITGKGGRQRLVPVLPVIAAAIDDYLAACPYQEPAGARCSSARAASGCRRRSCVA